MKKLLIMAGAALMLLPACKPTEGGYKAAYDAALAKRQEAAADAMAPDGTLLVNDDETTLMVMGGDTVLVRTGRFRYVDDSEMLKGELPKDPKDFQKEPPEAAKGTDGPKMNVKTSNVAVAMYKMRANALSNAAALRGKGMDSYVLVDGDDRFYTIASGFGSLPEAREFIRQFKASNPDYPYIGLPGAPVVLSIPL